MKPSLGGQEKLSGMCELDDRDREILALLEMLLRGGQRLDGAIRTLKAATSDSERVDRLVVCRQKIADELLFFAFGDVVHDAEEYGKGWYTGPQRHDHFWPALRAHLEADPRWAATVPSLDRASDEVVTLLHDPRTDKFATRGLVVGYVQSGKTANFTATIAKAADAGYRLFIVLSGVHNALRRQTQLRMDSHLVNLKPERWVPLTSELADFGNPIRALPIIATPELRALAVVKKNASRLQRLCSWLDTAQESGALDNCPILVIDDEADQASPNSARDAWNRQTRINQLTEQLIARRKVAYVGYTATPYANVLMNANVTGGLYPRHFMFSLPKPEGYFGGEELFCSEDVVEDEVTTAHDMIRDVNDEESDLIGEIHAGADLTGTVKSLEDAVRWFVLATAARRWRGQADHHSSMLIHTSSRATDHQNMRTAIIEVVKRLKQSWDSKDHEAWSNQWLAESAREPAERHELVSPNFDELTVHISATLSSVSIVVDNYREPTPNRLMYGDDPAVVIVIGGNVLSRGLTLEGLISSYFVRRSGQYDALLQMGRWFGYRPGYSDLPRIWTTAELENRFRFLSLVETEVRRDINRYRDENVSPSKAAVRIRTHPAMSVTARNKMQFAVEGGTSYGGQHPQTTYFHHRDRNIIHSNRQAVVYLLTTAREKGTLDNSKESHRLIQGVPAADVLACIRAFRFHGDTALDSTNLMEYVREENRLGNLLTWNVAVVSKQPSPTDGKLDLGLDEEVSCLFRSKLRIRSDLDKAGIGTLMSRADRWIDLGLHGMPNDREILEARGALGRALLLIYPIDKASRPRTGAKDRLDLDAADHLIGLGFAFPPAHEDNSITATIQLDPALLSAGQDESDAGADDDTENDHEVKDYES